MSLLFFAVVISERLSVSDSGMGVRSPVQLQTAMLGGWAMVTRYLKFGLRIDTEARLGNATHR